MIKTITLVDAFEPKMKKKKVELDNLYITLTFLICRHEGTLLSLESSTIPVNIFNVDELYHAKIKVRFIPMLYICSV